MSNEYYEIYRVDGQLYAQDIDNGYFVVLKEQYGRYFAVPRETGTQFFITVDNAIGHEDATALIERIKEDRVVHIHIDLSEMKVTKYNYNDEREC